MHNTSPKGCVRQSKVGIRRPKTRARSRSSGVDYEYPGQNAARDKQRGSEWVDGGAKRVCV